MANVKTTRVVTGNLRFKEYLTPDGKRKRLEQQFQVMEHKPDGTTVSMGVIWEQVPTIKASAMENEIFNKPNTPYIG